MRNGWLILPRFHVLMGSFILQRFWIAMMEPSLVIIWMTICGLHSVPEPLKTLAILIVLQAWSFTRIVGRNLQAQPSEPHWLQRAQSKVWAVLVDAMITPGWRAFSQRSRKKNFIVLIRWRWPRRWSRRLSLDISNTIIIVGFTAPTMVSRRSLSGHFTTVLLLHNSPCRWD